jgi:hypothetical protein
MIVNGQPHALGGSTKRREMIVIALAFVTGFGVKQPWTAAFSQSVLRRYFFKFGPS